MHFNMAGKTEEIQLLVYYHYHATYREYNSNLLIFPYKELESHHILHNNF